MKPLLFIALDGLSTEEEKTLEIAERLSKIKGNLGFKLNLDYLLKEGTSSAIKKIQRFGRPIFADIKMFNGTRTMIDVIRDLIELEVDYLDVYALADDLLPEAIAIADGKKTKVLGLTILTHFDEAYCQKHFKRSLRETVRHFSEVAVEAGCDGVILPGPTLEIVSDFNIVKLVPGVRPEWYKDTRHKEETKEDDAIAAGADIIVVGGPIMKSDNPTESTNKILSKMEDGERRRKI
jgi:orotidine-5'-phosphate decarboxylase